MTPRLLGTSNDVTHRASSLRRVAVVPAASMHVCTRAASLRLAWPEALGTLAHNDWPKTPLDA